MRLGECGGNGRNPQTITKFCIPSGSHYAHTALSFALSWNKRGGGFLNIGIMKFKK